MLVVHNEMLLGLLRHHYNVEDLDALIGFLHARGTLEFRPLPNGIFPASVVTPSTAYTGYSRAWVRDNVQVAHALSTGGAIKLARHNIATLTGFFRRQTRQFEAIINGEVDPSDKTRRPPIRFRADDLEVDEAWANAQNDALGYFLWLYCRLANQQEALQAVDVDWDVLALFPPFLEAIQYWRDEDSGHWEETPKISASSIGAVVAGMKGLLELVRRFGLAAIPLEHREPLATDRLENLLIRGIAALDAILPAESIQAEPLKQRRYDAALLFLINPLDVVRGAMAEQIVKDVGQHLAGEVGVRRYRGDSFWCDDYRRKLRADERARDWSTDLATRNALLTPGEEAQWCLFDPVLSLIAGSKFRRCRQPEDLELQAHHLNRSLAHLTARSPAFVELRCPELYYRENGRYETSDATPLLWTQAALLSALASMRESVTLK